VFLGGVSLQNQCHSGTAYKNFTDECILAAYKQQFKLLESKGHKIKLNVMDNQASRVIKEYLTLQRCQNLLVKPNKH
jgi:hypothetical protein